MSKYAIFTPGGLPVAFYDEAINPIPVEAVELTDAQWRDFVDHPGQRRWNGASVVPWAYVPSLAEIKKTRKDQLADYRWTLMRGGNQWLNGVMIDASTESRSRIAIGLMGLQMQGPAAPAEFTFKDPFGAYHTLSTSLPGTWLAMLERTESMVAFSVEAAFASEIDQMQDVPAVEDLDVVAEFDSRVKPILAADLSQFAYPEKYYRQDNQ